MVGSPSPLNHALSNGSGSPNGQIIKSPIIPQSLRRLFRRNLDIKAYFEQPHVASAVLSALTYYDSLANRGVTPDDFVQRCITFPLEQMENTYRFLDSRYRMLSIRNDGVSGYFLCARELLRPHIIATRKIALQMKNSDGQAILQESDSGVSVSSGGGSDLRIPAHQEVVVETALETTVETMPDSIIADSTVDEKGVRTGLSQMEQDLRVLEEMFRHPESIPQEILDIRL